MKKINKNINIVLIFMLIGVFLCQGITFAKDCSLRPALQTANPGFRGQMAHLQIRQRYEELRKRFGSKAAWLIILKELGLPEKLGFEIPPFVCFERKEAKAIYDKYESENIEGILRGFKEEIGFQIVEYSLLKLYRVDMTRADLKEQLELLFDKKFKPLLEYASKEKWVDFFTLLRLSPNLRRLINNHKQKYPYPEHRINRDAVDYLTQAIKSFLLLNTFSPEEKDALLRKVQNLPLRMIVRSSGFKEDSFETSMAGAYISQIVDKFNWLWGVTTVMSPNNMNTITDDFVDTDYTIFIQEYIPAEKAGIVFSNLSGYTTIECVVGDGSTAVEGWNNTIIDLDQDGRIEEINQGCYEGAIRSISWGGFKLDLKGAIADNSEAEKIIKRIRNDNMTSVKNMNGGYNESPFSEKDIQFVRNFFAKLTSSGLHDYF